MPSRAERQRAAERVEMVRTLLEQRSEMAAAGRMNLSELEWVLFRLGCPKAEGEKLIALAKAPKESHEIERDTAGSGYERWTCRSCSSTCLRAPFMSDAVWSAKLQTWQRLHPEKAVPLSTAPAT